MIDTAAVPEKEAPNKGAISRQAADFLDAIKTREAEFEKTWWKKGRDAASLYAGDTKEKHDDETPYNILYSNTEVLLPSLYSATPKPDIRTRFKGMDLKPLPDLVERFLTVAADPAQPGEDCFDTAMADSVLSALVPGMGYVRIRYIENKSFPIVYESGHFETILWGKASRWAKVPWVAFRHPMKREQMFEQFGISLEAGMAGYKPSSEAEEDKDDCCVYELWDKKTRKVYFLSEEWHEKLLKESDDPLGLTNFFPTPGLMLLTAKPGKLQPVPLYSFYRNQAEELNRVSVRLNKVLSAIRVRGAYNSMLGKDLEKILASDDLENEFVAAGEAALLAQSGGFDKHIWMLPIEKLIVVAQELYKAREAIKVVIYELTGISDIIRGSSVASETATAQDLKAKWGTVRLRKMQTIVANYARDLFRMTVDCGSDHVSPEQWKAITQSDFPTEQEQVIAKQQLAYTQQTQQVTPGQPPQQPDPALLKAAQAPTIEKLLEKIKSDVNRTFVINIQTSSTVDMDNAQDKAEVNEFMNAMGQFMSSIQPLLTLGPTGLEAAKAMLIGVCQRFKFSIDMTDSLTKIQMPPPVPEKAPPGPSPEEQQVLKEEAQLKLQEIAAKRQVVAAKLELELAQVDAAKQKLALDIQGAQLAMEQKRTKLRSQPQGGSDAGVPS